MNNKSIYSDGFKEQALVKVTVVVTGLFRLLLRNKILINLP